jgi:hypothetical protein
LFAHIGIMHPLHGNVVRVFDTSRTQGSSLVRFAVSGWVGSGRLG